MKGTLALIALIVLILLAIAVPATASVGADHLIRPGQGIGPIDLSVTLEDLKAKLGPEDDVVNDEVYLLYAWKTGEGFIGALVNNGKVIGAEVVHDPEYATAQGLHTGMTKDEVLALMGKPARIATKDTRTRHDDGTESLVSVEQWFYSGLVVVIPQADLRTTKAGQVWLTKAGQVWLICLCA